MIRTFQHLAKTTSGDDRRLWSGPNKEVMDRIELERKLNDGRNWILEQFTSLEASVLHAPLTPSEHDPTNHWSPLDHFVHLALIEIDFTAMVRRHVSGSSNPVRLLQDDEGNRRSREQIMAAVHAMTEEWQIQHRSRTLSEVVAITSAARAGTLRLIAELSDEQLLETMPGAPWADGTVGGVLGANADHGHMHWNWLTRAGLELPATE
jgi:hypothetical protein